MPVLLTVAVIGPAHALKGEARLEIRTDDPAGRLAPGSVLPTEPEHAGPLTVSRLRFDGQRWYAAFEEAPDRTAVEALRGVRLMVEVDESHHEDSEDDDGWYAYELVGLRAVLAGSDLNSSCDSEDDQAQHSAEAPVSPVVLGQVVDLDRGVAQDRLIVRTPEGVRVAVPFVEQLVPDIDLEAGTVTLDPPGGLFPGLGETEEAR